MADGGQAVGMVGGRGSRLAFPRTYFGAFGRRASLQILLVAALVEAIFIAEKLNEIVLTVLDQRAPGGYIPLFIVLRMPEVFNLALPIAVVIACYRAALQAREDREFLVVAGMGVSVGGLVRMAALVGVAALAISAVVSGFVAPAAQYAQRFLLFEARYAALRDGGSPGAFFRFGDHTVFVASNLGGSAPNRLFIHRRVDGTDDTERLAIAEAGRLEGLDGDGPAVLRLADTTVLDFSTATGAGEAAGGQPIACPTCTRLPRSFATRAIRTHAIEREIDRDEITDFKPRGSVVAEVALDDLLTGATTVGAKTRALEIGHRLGRLLLCLVAPFVAGLALAFADRRTQAFAVPAAAAVLLALDVVVGSLVEGLAGAGVVAVMSGVVVPIGLTTAGLVILAGRAHARLIVPAMARA